MQLHIFNNKKVFIIVPAFNEALTIGDVVAGLQQYSVVVVDDGSNDDTLKIAFESGAIVLRHLVNLGQGAALQTGIEFAVQAGAEFIVTFDADNQHDPADIRPMLDALLTGNHKVALGSRFVGQTVGMPRLRRFVIRFATIITRITTGLKITDVHNGFRAFTAEGAKKIHLRQNKMAHASEILNQIAKQGLSYCEVAVTIRYTKHSLRKGQKLFGAFDIVSDLAKERVKR